MKRRDIEKALRAKGFEQQPGGDHRYYRLFVSGKKTSIQTHVSRGSKSHQDLGDDLVSAMARQTKLTTRQFRELVDCKLDGSGYVAVLREKNAL